jgi:hypothetical protein
VSDIGYSQPKDTTADCKVTGLWAGQSGVHFRKGNGFFCSAKLLDWLWSALSLLFNTYGGFFRGQSDQTVEVTNHLHVALGSEQVELYLNSPYMSPWREEGQRFVFVPILVHF